MLILSTIHSTPNFSPDVQPWAKFGMRRQGLFYSIVNCYFPFIRLHDGLTCMGTRRVVEVTEERQPDGRGFQKLVLGAYDWLNYEDIDNMVSNVTRALNVIDIKKGQHVVIYSETRMEWAVSAFACFKSGLPSMTMKSF